MYLAHEDISPQAGDPNPEHIRLGQVTITPFEKSDGAYTDADARGYQYLLDFMGGSNRFQTYSLLDVLEGKLKPELIKDSVVIVGVNAESVKDEFLTPYDRFSQRGQYTSGIAVHGYEVSQLLRSALEGDEPMRVLSDYTEFLWILLWSIAAALICLIARSSLKLSIFSILALLLLTGSTYFAFLNHWWLPVVPTAIAWLTSSGLVTMVPEYETHPQSNAGLSTTADGQTPPSPMVIEYPFPQMIGALV